MICQEKMKKDLEEASGMKKREVYHKKSESDHQGVCSQKRRLSLKDRTCNLSCQLNKIVIVFLGKCIFCIMMTQLQRFPGKRLLFP